MRDDFERIRKELKALAKVEGLKLSITSSRYNKLNVSVMSAPAEMLYTEEYGQVNQYYIETSKELTRYGKEICTAINNIILKEHWDESDSMTDYFHCAFYYDISIGKWGKPFTCTWEKKAA